MVKTIVLTVIFVLGMALISLAGEVPPFPWSAFAKGILAEEGIVAASQAIQCSRAQPVIFWDIQRANGERWRLWVSLVEARRRWVGVQIDPFGTPLYFYAGTWDGDAIVVLKMEEFDELRHPGPCPNLFPVEI